MRQMGLGSWGWREAGFERALANRGIQLHGPLLATGPAPAKLASVCRRVGRATLASLFTSSQSNTAS